MTAYGPRLIDGGYAYAKATPTGELRPIGYCAGWRDWSAEDRKRFFLADTEWARMLTNREKYHSHGHASAAEALECYRRYLLDTVVRLDDEEPDEASCVICETPTTRRAAVAGRARYVLCDVHRTQPIVESLFTAIIEAPWP